MVAAFIFSGYEAKTLRLFRGSRVRGRVDGTDQNRLYGAESMVRTRINGTNQNRWYEPESIV